MYFALILITVYCVLVRLRNYAVDRIQRTPETVTYNFKEPRTELKSQSVIARSFGLLRVIRH